MAFKDSNIRAAYGFETGDFIVRAITVADNELDYATAMAKQTFRIEHPEEPGVTLAYSR